MGCSEFSISERNIWHWKTSSLIFCYHSKHFVTLPTRQDPLFRHEETETYDILLLFPTALHIYLLWKIRDSAKHCLLKSSGVNDCTFYNVCCTLNSPPSCLKINGNLSSAIWRQPGLDSLWPIFGRNRNQSNHFALGTAPYFDLRQRRGETNEVTCKNHLDCAFSKNTPRSAQSVKVKTWKTASNWKFILSVNWQTHLWFIENHGPTQAHQLHLAALHLSKK